jgi:hypothetical protein
MAVENKYVDSNIVVGKKALTGAAGAEIVAYTVTFEVAAADDDGSVYRVLKGIPANVIPFNISIVCDAITSGTDWDLGVYKTDFGAVVDKDILMDGQTFATALTRATGHQLGLGAVNADKVNATLATLSGQTNPDDSYDLALTANTVGSAAGTVSVIAEFLVAA